MWLRWIWYWDAMVAFETTMPLNQRQSNGILPHNFLFLMFYCRMWGFPVKLQSFLRWSFIHFKTWALQIHGEWAWRQSKLRWNLYRVHIILFLKQKITAISTQRKGRFNGFLNMVGLDAALSNPKDCMDVQVTEVRSPSVTDICNINLTTAGEWAILRVVSS